MCPLRGRIINEESLICDTVIGQIMVIQLHRRIHGGGRVSVLIKKACKIESGSGVPNKSAVNFEHGNFLMQINSPFSLICLHFLLLVKLLPLRQDLHRDVFVSSLSVNVSFSLGSFCDLCHHKRHNFLFF